MQAVLFIAFLLTQKGVRGGLFSRSKSSSKHVGSTHQAPPPYQAQHSYQAPPPYPVAPQHAYPNQPPPPYPYPVPQKSGGGPGVLSVAAGAVAGGAAGALLVPLATSGIKHLRSDGNETAKPNETLTVASSSVVETSASLPSSPATARSASPSSAYELTVVHTNDLHCRFSKHNWLVDRCPPGFTGSCFGGYDAIKGFYDQVKIEEKNVLHLNAGDNIDIKRTNWCGHYHGNASAHFGNMMEWDAVSLGNHEFDVSESHTADYVKQSHFTIVAANMESDKDSGMKDRYQGHKVVERGGRKIGIIGYLLNVTCYYAPSSERGAPYISPKHSTFTCETQAVYNTAEKLRRDGVDIIIALGHSGLPEYDITLAKEVPNIDLVVGGHSHSFLWNGEWVTKPSDGEENIQGSYPYVATNQLTGIKVPIVHCYKWGKYACKIKLQFDDKGIVTNWTGAPTLLDDKVRRDPVVQEEIKKWEAQIPSWNDELVTDSIPWRPSYPPGPAVPQEELFCSC